MAEYSSQVILREDGESIEIKLSYCSTILSPSEVDRLISWLSSRRTAPTQSLPFLKLSASRPR